MYFHGLFSKFRGVKSEYVSPPCVLCFMEQATFRGAGTNLSCRKASDKCCVVKVSMALLNHHFQAPNTIERVQTRPILWSQVIFSDTCTATIVNPKNPSFFWINHFCRKFVSSPVCRWLRFSLMRVRQQAT